MKRAGYREAVDWIARNDDVDTMDPDAVSGYLTTALVADLFGKTQAEVADAVVRKRQQLADEAARRDCETMRAEIEYVAQGDPNATNHWRED